MPLDPTWTDVSFRLLCCFIACLLVGLDREWQERAAGMRTTILVGLAACIAAISANFMLGTAEDAAQDFVRMDVLRLPLGILTGMGFIGAGAIMRRSDGFVHGVTTAATLWFVTVMGLCFGVGQLFLGAAALGLSLATLWGLKFFEVHLRTSKEAALTLHLGREGPSEERIKQIVTGSGVRIRRMFVSHEPGTGQRTYRFSLWCHAAPGEPPPFIAELRDAGGIEQLDWEM